MVLHCVSRAGPIIVDQVVPKCRPSGPVSSPTFQNVDLTNINLILTQSSLFFSFCKHSLPFQQQQHKKMKIKTSDIDYNNSIETLITEFPLKSSQCREFPKIDVRWIEIRLCYILCHTVPRASKIINKLLLKYYHI